MHRTAQIVPVSAAGPASAREVPGGLRVADGGAGHRIPLAWRMAACRGVGKQTAAVPAA